MSHNHCHDETHTIRSFNAAFAIAVFVNLSFTLLEFAYGYTANSVGLLGDAAHNFGDTFGLLLSWGANWLLLKPAGERYTYGYRRTSILAAIINALLLVASSALIGYEAIYHLMHGSQVNEFIIIIVAFIGIFINGGTALLFIKGSHDDLNIKGAFLHLLSDALISAGVVVAGIAIYFTGYNWIDPVSGLLIITVILWGTWGLLRDSVGLLLDATPTNIDHRGISDYLSNLPNVVAIHDLHIWSLSTREIALTAHIVMPQAHISSVDYKTINTTLKDTFLVNHATIQVEIENSDYICIRSEKC
ncbi:MAG: cation diffusion facilitator family transporter [Legionella sp.]|jgi:cobalt-zinc-cadmium efflux system protein